MEHETRDDAYFMREAIKDSIDAGLPEINITSEELNKRSDSRIEIKGNFLRDECLGLIRKVDKNK